MNSVADVSHGVSYLGGFDPGVEGLACDLDEVFVFGAWCANDEGAGGVTAPSVKDRTKVDGHDVTVCDQLVGGDTVDHGVVDGCTDGSGEG